MSSSGHYRGHRRASETGAAFLDEGLGPLDARPKRLLVVDEDRERGEAIARCLRQIGQDGVDLVRDPLAATETLAAGGYELCLLSLPSRDAPAFETLNWIRENVPNTVSAIAIVNAGDYPTARRAMSLGADGRVQNPFTAEDLRLAVDWTFRDHLVRRQGLRYRDYLKEQVQRKAHEHQILRDDAVKALAECLMKRDAYTGKHSRRVSEIAALIARRLELSDMEIAEIRVGASLHDIGKIGIRDEILRKRGALTEEEREELRKHPLIGRDILKNIAALASVIPCALRHHERFDGAGYPDGVGGEDIPLACRVIAIADALDAMTSTRVYRERLDFNVAAEEIRQSAGAHFDPDAVRAFEGLAREKAFAHILIS